MKDFAAIREVKGRQILLYTESDYDGNTLHVLTRTSNEINVNIKLGYEDDEQKMWNMFEIFKTEEKLESLPFIQALIENLESIEEEGRQERK
jgi:CTP synthase (UTP-ammonia lyase)